MIDLLIIAPSEEITQHTPIGFTLLDQIFTEAGLKDKVSDPHTMAEKLRHTLIYLKRRYPRRITMQWVEPMSLRGLFLKFRYHLRAYPVVLIRAGEEIRVFNSNEIIHLADRVAEMLSIPVNSQDKS